MKLENGHRHICAPRDWRKLPNLTGDYDLDATIQHRSNPDMIERLKTHLRRGAYGPITGYGAYANYMGDT